MDKKLVERVDKMLSEDVPKLMSMIPQEEHAYLQIQTQSTSPNSSALATNNTIFTDQQATPFEYGGVEGINAGLGEADWIVTRSRHEYDQVFQQLSPQNGKISGASAKQEMIKSKLPNNVLGRVWKLSDVDKDGMLDIDEWALAQHLSRIHKNLYKLNINSRTNFCFSVLLTVKIKLEGHELPNALPDHLVPPSKRHLVTSESPNSRQSGLYPSIANNNDQSTDEN